MKKMTWLLVLTLLLTACGTGDGSSSGTVPRKPDAPDLSAAQTTEAPAEPTGETAAPSGNPEDKPAPGAFAGTWTHREFSGTEELVYRLILSADGTAQLVMQNGIGEMLGLSFGTWSPESGSRMELLLQTDLVPEDHSSGRSFGGSYEISVTQTGSMTFRALDGATGLLPEGAQGPEAGVFYREDSFELTGRPGFADELIRVAGAYYKSVAGSAYGGITDLESWGPEGALIRLYEDLEDHIATQALYCINPNTLQGTDEITGETVDFSRYRIENTPSLQTPTEPSAPEKAWGDWMLSQMDLEGTYEYDGGSLDYSYHIPQVLDDGADAALLNDMLGHLDGGVRDGEKPQYAFIGWEHHWYESILSLVVTLVQPYSGEADYYCYNYDCQSGKLLWQDDLLNRWNVTREAFTDALRRAAAEAVEQDDVLLHENFGPCFAEIMVLRAQTVSRRNLAGENIQVYVDETGSLQVITHVGTIAGGGVYQKVLTPRLHPEFTVHRKENHTYVTAELADNRVTVTYAPEAADALEGTFFEPGVAYEVEGLYGEYTDLYLGASGNEIPDLYLLDTRGRVTYCCLIPNKGWDRLIALGTLMYPQGVTGFCPQAREDGPSVSAVLSDGSRVSLQDPVLEAMWSVPEPFRDRTWETEDGICQMMFHRQDRSMTWGVGMGVSAEGWFSYAGVTEDGIFFPVWLQPYGESDAPAAGGYLQLQTEHYRTRYDGEDPWHISLLKRSGSAIEHLEENVPVLLGPPAVG